jgi:hypothetical protein
MRRKGLSLNGDRTGGLRKCGGICKSSTFSSVSRKACMQNLKYSPNYFTLKETHVISFSCFFNIPPTIKIEYF